MEFGLLKCALALRFGIIEAAPIRSVVWAFSMADRWVLFSVALSDQLRKTGSGNPHLLCKCSLMIAEQPAAEICDIVPELESYAY